MKYLLSVFVVALLAWGCREASAPSGSSEPEVPSAAAPLPPSPTAQLAASAQPAPATSPGAQPAAASPAPAKPDLPALPAHYAPLFVVGREFKYATSSHTRFMDGDPSDEDGDRSYSVTVSGRKSCRVAEVRGYDDAAAALIVCGKREAVKVKGKKSELSSAEFADTKSKGFGSLGLFAEPFENKGVFLATPAGLWFAAQPALPANRMAIAQLTTGNPEAPAEFDMAKAKSVDLPGGGKGKAWCKGAGKGDLDIKRCYAAGFGAVTLAYAVEGSGDGGMDQKASARLEAPAAALGAAPAAPAPSPN